jgi:hypothetical protein
MPDSEAKTEKPKIRGELFYRDGPFRADEILHQEILDGGDEVAAQSVSRKVAGRLGISDAAMDRLFGKKQSKTKR